jgi:antitoxin MazE
MKTTIRRMGNSHGVLIPKPLLAELGLQVGDPVEMKVKKGRLVVAPCKKKLREGWAEAGKTLAAAGEGGLVWPEPGNGQGEDGRR